MHSSPFLGNPAILFAVGVGTQGCAPPLCYPVFGFRFPLFPSSAYPSGPKLSLG
jgi:hypothetical protein